MRSDEFLHHGQSDARASNESTLRGGALIERRKNPRPFFQRNSRPRIGNIQHEVTFPAFMPDIWND